MAHAVVGRNRLWSRLNGAVARHPEPLATPLMVVDLDAFDANADDLVRRAAGTPIRVASKSLRVPALLRRALAHDGFHGVLAYTLREALWLHEEGISDDIVVAYPTVDPAALARLVGSPSAAAHITLMVDDVAHLDVVDAQRASRAVPVRVA
ncbi:MAG: alanine racemase, partial [Nocardioides sp.]